MIYFIIIYLVIGFLFGMISRKMLSKEQWNTIDKVLMFLNDVLAWPVLFIYIIIKFRS